MEAIHWAKRGRAALDLTETVCLEPNEIYCLPHGTFNVQVLRGTAWITAQAEDFILEGGDQMTIPRQPHAILVSVVGHQPLRLELRKL